MRPSRPMAEIDDRVLERHVAVLGASGAGKSTFLAHLARARVRRGLATVVLDVHGDLGPAIVTGLDPGSRERLIAIDAARPVEEVAGIALFPSEDPEGREREAAHLVAALRHLSSDGVERYWGHRLEQTFDVFVRLVEEERGGFLDLYEPPDGPEPPGGGPDPHAPAGRDPFPRRAAGLLRRNPDYLQPAVARVQKVALNPKLARLLDADEGAIDLGARLSAGVSIVFRIPSAELGPSEYRFAATLLASRVYLAAASARSRASGLRVLAVLDEAQAISPSLLAEILAEGRKFGFGAIVATQYAARLAPEALEAAEGAAGSHLVFHVPRSGAAAAGRWVGLDREEAEQILPGTTSGDRVRGPCALARPPRLPSRTPPPVEPDLGLWEAQCVRTARETGVPETFLEGAVDGVTADEAILLGLLGLESQGRPGRQEALLEAAQRVVPGLESVDVAARLPALLERGWIERTDGIVRLTPARGPTDRSGGRERGDPGERGASAPPRRGDADLRSPRRVVGACAAGSVRHPAPRWIRPPPPPLFGGSEPGRASRDGPRPIAPMGLARLRRAERPRRGRGLRGRAARTDPTGGREGAGMPEPPWCSWSRMRGAPAGP